MEEFQRKLLERLHIPGRFFLEGPAGAGKTTLAVAWLERLLRGGVSGEHILVLLPQRTLSAPYERLLRDPSLPPAGLAAPLTMGGLARRMVDLFWPLVLAALPFSPHRPPTFLTLETAQYYMAHLIGPLLDQGLFETIKIERHRLYSQILDNLNKAALIGFPIEEIGERLQAAWQGDPVRRHVFEDVQTCATLFRKYCFEHNLLDFSLQMEIFRGYLWQQPECRAYLQRSFRHLIYDNTEEDAPVAHDLIGEWLPDFETALLIYDWGAGYRRFLGADPHSAYALRQHCDWGEVFPASRVCPPEVQALETALTRAIFPIQTEPINSWNRFPEGQPWLLRSRRGKKQSARADPRRALQYESFRFFPQMLDWVAEQAQRLVVEMGTPPGEIAILSPYLSDALRFSLISRLEERGLPVYSVRPSRALREEPVTRGLLTLAALAMPQLGWTPAKADVRLAFLLTIEGMDLARAHLLTEIVFRVQGGQARLSSFDQINPEMQERLTYRLGQRYERLRTWLAEAANAGLELDHFLSRLFGEVLSQPGFNFHQDFSAGEVTANLIESIQKFRWATGDILAQEGINLGAEYCRMLQEGVVAAQYVRSWQEPPAEAILVAPAYTFLLSNRPVDYQFWLDVASSGWGERLNQPLTHPYVLSRHWQAGRTWKDAEEVETGQAVLQALTAGLLRRCRRGIFLGFSVLGEQGYEQRGPLQQAFQLVLQRMKSEISRTEEESHA